jgi:amino acid permease
LGVLAYFSARGVLASVIVAACVFCVGAVDGVGFHEMDMLLNLGGLPTAISLFALCYCGHAVFPTLCKSMKDRSQFSKVSNSTPNSNILLNGTRTIHIISLLLTFTWDRKIDFGQ